jgi:hypothetical protein
LQAQLNRKNAINDSLRSMKSAKVPKKALVQKIVDGYSSHSRFSSRKAFEDLRQKFLIAENEFKVQNT